MKLKLHGREDRRLRAKARFRIIPNADRNPVLSDVDYADYLDRKVTEAKALGLVPANAGMEHALSILL